MTHFLVYVALPASVLAQDAHPEEVFRVQVPQDAHIQLEEMPGVDVAVHKNTGHPDDVFWDFNRPSAETTR